MPAPTTSCFLCGAEKSKRQTLSIEHDGKTGRACREHPEVAAYLEKLLQDSVREKIAEQADTFLKVTAIASLIEVQAFRHGSEAFKTRLLNETERRYGQDIRDRVEAELATRKPMTAESVAADLQSFLALARH